MPRGLQSLTLMNTSQGTYAMGGQDKDRNARNEVLQLDCQGDQIQSCHWKEVENLQFARSSHVAIALPEYYDVYCTTTTDKTAQHNSNNGVIVAVSILLLLLCFLLSWKFAIVPKMPWFYR